MVMMMIMMMMLRLICLNFLHVIAVPLFLFDELFDRAFILSTCNIISKNNKIINNILLE